LNQLSHLLVLDALSLATSHMADSLPRSSTDETIDPARSVTNNPLCPRQQGNSCEPKPFFWRKQCGEAAMVTKANRKTPEEQARENCAGNQELEDELEAELEGSFPASDPPSLTQPSTRPGGPRRRISGGERQKSRRP
jgi:hypothetical protein